MPWVLISRLLGRIVRLAYSDRVNVGTRAGCIRGESLDAISLLNSNFFDLFCHFVEVHPCAGELQWFT